MLKNDSPQRQRALPVSAEAQPSGCPDGAAFQTPNQSALAALKGYIANQKAHPGRIGVGDDLSALVRQRALEWDERHLRD